MTSFGQGHTRSIGARVSWGLIAFGALAAFALAGAAIFFNEKLEASIMTTAINGQVSHVAALGRVAGGPEKIIEDAYQAYFVPAGAPVEATVPAWLRDGYLSDVEDVAHDGRYYEITRRQLPSGQVFVATDVTAIEVSEASFMVAVLACAIAFLLFSIYLARRVSQSIVSPLRELADAVGALEPTARGTRLSAQGDHDALDQIAVRFNDYLTELDAFVTRERNLSAMASHELRTPLAIIAGAVDVLVERHSDDAANLATLQRIKAAATRMHNSIDALLMLSRMRGAPLSSFAMVSANAVAQSAVEAVQPMLADKPVTLRVQAPTSVRVRCSEQLLAILIQNLVGNAIKFTPAGQVVVRLQDRRLEVQDEGPGMEYPSMAQLLAPHQRGGQAGVAGVGFGLYIVAEICRRFDWQLEFRLADSGSGTLASVFFGDCCVDAGTARSRRSMIL